MKIPYKTLLVASLTGVSWLSSSYGQSAFAGGLYDVYAETFAGSEIYTKLAHEVSAFTVSGKVQKFYNYKNSNFNGSTLLSSLKPNYSDLFLVEGSNGIALGFVYNANGNPSGVGGSIGSEFVLSSNVSSLSPTAGFTVIDDYTYNSTKTENITGSSKRKLTSFNTWGIGDTGGGLISDLSDTDTGDTNNKWSITAKFIPNVTGSQSSGITNWVFLSPDGANIKTTNLLANQSINYNILNELNGNNPKPSIKVLITPATSGFTPTPAFSFSPAATTPEPSSLIGLVMIGLMGGGAVVRSRFSKSQE